MRVIEMLTGAIIGVGLIFLGLMITEFGNQCEKRFNRTIASVTGLLMIAIGIAFEVVVLIQMIK